MTESSTVTPPSFPARCLYYVATGTASVKGMGGGCSGTLHSFKSASLLLLFILSLNSKEDSDEVKLL